MSRTYKAPVTSLYWISNNESYPPNSDATWSNILAGGKFDYIVIGSGCTALAFIDEVLKQDKNKRILCLERGGMYNQLLSLLPWSLIEQCPMYLGSQ